jgi:hypothetical protein
LRDPACALAHDVIVCVPSAPWSAPRLWASIYERHFGAAANRGRIGKAIAGSGAVAAAAYVTDYHVVPKRFTPGWETRPSPRSLVRVYGILALALPLRGLLRRWSR